jgi:hypothetical protein
MPTEALLLDTTLELLGVVLELLGLLDEETAAELELGTTLELPAMLDEEATAELELRTMLELLGLLDEETATELELGIREELLDAEFDEESTAELNPGLTGELELGTRAELRGGGVSLELLASPKPFSAEELLGLFPPPSDEQERVSVMARAMVAASWGRIIRLASCVLIVLPP